MVLSRPHFLLGGALLYALGAIIGGEADIAHYLLGQGMVTSAQATAHFVNEYADVEFDRFVTRRTLFSGGSGVLGSGRLSPGVALRAAQTATGLTLLLAGATFTISATAATIGLVALAVSWAYSMPPIRLLDTGWGEMVTSLTVAGLVPVVGATINHGSITPQLLWLMAALAPIHLAMMLAFELPDLESDRASGKTVLAVRVGEMAARKLMTTLYLLAVTITLAGVVLEQIPADWRLATSAAAAISTMWAAHRLRFRLLTTYAVATLVLFAAGVLIAL